MRIYFLFLLLASLCLTGCLSSGSRGDDDDDSAGDDDDATDDDDAADDDDATDDDDTTGTDCGPPPGASDFGPEDGQFLPDIPVQWWDDNWNTLSSHDLCGAATLIDLDATWNNIGQQAQQPMEDLYQQYGKNGLVVAAILFENSVGQPPSRGDLDDWASNAGLTFPILRATPDDGISLFHYGAAGIPYFIVLDSEMRIEGVVEGLQPALLVPLIESALGAR